MSNTIRCFISLDVSDDARKELKRIQKEFKQQNLFTGTYTNHKQFHLTIKFFRELEKKQLNQIKERLEQINFQTIKLKLRNVGFYGYEPQVIWVGVDSDSLKDLYNQIEDNIWDVFPSQRRFNAHITIARVKNIKYQMLLKKTITEMKVNPIEYEVDKFQLIESKLNNDKYEHTIIQEYTLGDNNEN